MTLDTLKTHVTDREARVSADEIVERWDAMLNTEAIELRAAVVFDALNRIFTDDPFVGRYLNEIRYDEMFHLGWIGSRLNQLQESRPEVAEWREQANDGLAAALTAYEAKAATAPA